MALLGAAWIPMGFLLNLYLQQVLGPSLPDSGLALAPMTVAIMILMVGATVRLVGRLGWRPTLVAGRALLAGARPAEGGLAARRVNTCYRIGQSSGWPQPI